MFVICWEKDGQKGWEKCHKANDIANVFVKNDLAGMVDTILCLSGGHDGCVMNYQQVLKAVNGELPIKGAYVYTPRFLSVMLEDVFPDRKTALDAGYKEPCHFQSDFFDVLGKSLGNNCMSFAAAMKPAGNNAKSK